MAAFEGGKGAARPRALLTSSGARVSLVFATLFLSTGFSMPYLTPWLQAERGLSGSEIGAIFSAAQLARLLTGPPLATWADGFKDRRTPILVFSAAAFVGNVLLFSAQGFWGIFFAAFFATTMVQQIIPLTEGMALRKGQEGPLSYGTVRAVGSGAFIVASTGGAAAVAAFGLGVAPVWVLTALALTVGAAAVLVPDPAPPHAAVMRFRDRLRAGAKLLANPRFVFVVVGAGLIQCSHAYFYVFSTALWRGQGIANTTIGLLWGFGVLVEVGLLFALVRLERRFRPDAFMLLGALGAVVRWVCMGFAPHGLLLWPLQALHGLSFAATHVGTMRVIQREAPEAVAGLAQTLYAGLGGGLLIGLATLGSGVLYDHVGPQGYWVMAGLAAAGGSLILFVTKLGAGRNVT